MNIEKELFYTKDHEWIRDLGDGTVELGITDYAQEKIGDVSYVELPDVDAEFAKEDVFCTVESFKAASDVFSPFDLKIIEVNEDLEDEPEKINESAYEAWIVKASATSLDGLLSASEYEKLLESEK